MDHDGIVRRVISRSDFLDATQHSEIERELPAHVEDIVDEARAQGYDEAAIIWRNTPKSHRLPLEGLTVWSGLS